MLMTCRRPQRKKDAERGRWLNQCQHTSVFVWKCVHVQATLHTTHEKVWVRGLTMCVSPVEEGLRGRRSPVAWQKAMCLRAGAGRRRLITIGSRLASNNDGSASVHLDTLTLIPQQERDHDREHQREKGDGGVVVDICRYATACRSAEQRLLSSISRSAE